MCYTPKPALHVSQCWFLSSRVAVTSLVISTPSFSYLTFCRSYAPVLFTLFPTLPKSRLYCCIGDASRRPFGHVSVVVDVFSFMYEQRTTSNSLDSSINILSARYRRVLSRSTTSSHFLGLESLVSLRSFHPMKCTTHYSSRTAELLVPGMYRLSN